MRITSNKRNGILIAITSALTLTGVVASFVSSKSFMMNLSANNYSVALNHNNAPTLNNGEGTRLDDKNITWEYHNASNSANGHVSISNEGYVGISSSSIYGYTGIDGLTINFTANEGSELWLLLSYDGVDWFESEMLTSNTETHAADNWRYIRFYCYDAGNNSININSINFSYVCTGGISGTDDVDYATVENVVSTLNLDASEETTIRSPVSNNKEKSTKAVKLTLQDNVPNSGSRYVIFGIPSTTLNKVKSYMLTFDYYHREKRDPAKTDRGYPTTKMAAIKKNDWQQIGTGRTKNSPVWSCTPINDDWWHVECYVAGIVQLGDNGPNTVIDGIAINDPNIYTYTYEGVETRGFFVVDNLRLVITTPKAAITNNWTAVKINPIVDPTANPKVDDRYYIRENYIGYLHDATYTLNKLDENVDARIYFSTEKNGNKLTYIEGLEPGQITVTITYVLGYTHQTVTISTATLTVENYPPEENS